MSTKYKHPGRAMDWLNDTGADVATGDMVQLDEGMVGIAETNIKDGAIGALTVSGVYEVGSGGVAMAQGQRVNLAADPAVLDPAGLHTVYSAAAATDTTVDVLINSSTR